MVLASNSRCVQREREPQQEHPGEEAYSCEMDGEYPKEGFSLLNAIALEFTPLSMRTNVLWRRQCWCCYYDLESGAWILRSSIKFLKTGPSVEETRTLLSFSQALSLSLVSGRCKIRP